jgi:hypothetical protein
MDAKQEKEIRALAQILDRDGLTVFPGHSIPANTEFQVCTTHPVEGVQNYESVCCDCNCPVWFADKHHPHLKKLCIPCYLEQIKTGKFENIGNEFSLAIANLVKKRN